MKEDKNLPQNKKHILPLGVRLGLWGQFGEDLGFYQKYID